RNVRRRHPQEAHHRDRREQPLASKVGSPAASSAGAELCPTSDVVLADLFFRTEEAKAQVITRCRLTGHYMFMGMDVDPKEFTRSPPVRLRASSARFAPAITCGTRRTRSSWRPRSCCGPIFNKRADRSRGRPSQRRSASRSEQFLRDFFTSARCSGHNAIFVDQSFRPAPVPSRGRQIVEIGGGGAPAPPVAQCGTALSPGAPGDGCVLSHLA